MGLEVGVVDVVVIDIGGDEVFVCERGDVFLECWIEIYFFECCNIFDWYEEKWYVC